MRGRLGLVATLAVLVGAPHTSVLAQPRPERVLTLDEVLKGNDDSKLRWPQAVAAASADQISVADIHESRIFFFKRVGVSWTLEHVAKFPETPVDIVWDRDRYVVSTRRPGVLFAIGDPRKEPIEIGLPANLRPGVMAALPSGGQLVYDQNDSRIVRVGRSGDSLGTTPIDDFVTGLASRVGGGWLAAIGDKGQIAVFDANGRAGSRWNLPGSGPVPAWPAGLATDSDGRVYVADRHNGRILVLDASGRWIGLGSRKGWDPGLLIRPAGLAKLPRGQLLVADQGNGRAQLFRPTFDSAAP